MWIKKYEYNFLKDRARIASRLEELNRCRLAMERQETEQPEATVTVWLQDGQYSDIKGVQTYTHLGNARYIFYNKKGWVLAEIGDVADIYFVYPEKNSDKCSCETQG